MRNVHQPHSGPPVAADEAAAVVGQRPRRRRFLAAALGLFVLAPLFGEYLLGNMSIDALVVLPFLAPMYGGGALLIREITRRAGRGWSTIILLGVAYALVEEGILDQMLFNPSYFGVDMLSAAYVPGLGIGGLVTVTVVAMHTVWSIALPIAIVEVLAGERGTTPWLGRVGLAVTGVVFLLGSAAVFYYHLVELRFLASFAQLAGTTVAIVVLIVAGLALGRRPRPLVEGRAPRPWLVGAVTLVGSSLFFLAPDWVSDWAGVGIDLVLAATVGVLLVRWSRREGWRTAHGLAAASGATLTYAWLGFTQTPMGGSGGLVKLVGNAVFALAAIGLVVLAARKIRRPRGSSPPVG